MKQQTVFLSEYRNQSSVPAWNGRPYYSLDAYLKETFGEKVYRLSLNAGLTCPNRDGTLHTRGCIFCSRGGSGDFAAAPAASIIGQAGVTPVASITGQLNAAKSRIVGKTHCRKFIAYFQAYTNTYGPVSDLRRIFMEAAAYPDIVALSIATRPDCLPEQVLELLSELSRQIPVWIELGLQTIHDDSRRFLRSGFSLSCFTKAAEHLKERGIPVIVHVILGLPGETKSQMLETIDYLGAFGIDGIKLQLLHLLTDTDLYEYYRKHPFPLLELEEYCQLICDCIEHLPPEVVIHRLTGDGPKKLLAAPLWSSNKKQVLNRIHQAMRERGTWQGKYWDNHSWEGNYGRSLDTI